MAKGMAIAEIDAHVTGLHGLAALADGLTNSCMQAVLAEMNKTGLRGGLRDSRKLRNELHAVIAANIGEHVTHLLTSEAK
jgi:hypothetical protein